MHEPTNPKKIQIYLIILDISKTGRMPDLDGDFL